MTPVRAPSKQVMATTPLASVEGVTKRFSGGAHPAIDDLNLRVEPGRVTGLVGPDGAGKTTLMRLLAALMVPTEGRIVTCGHDTRGELSEIRRSVSYMPQRFGLYEDLTVAENLDLYADLGGVVGEERRQAMARLLGFTNLGPFTARLAGQLSGGMKQKLGLACALVHKPRLLLLDEPSVGVDPISRRELWQMVYDLVDEGIGVVWSTAYLDEAERCAWVLLLNEGQALYEGPPKELTNRVAGRTFLIQNAGDRRRTVLARAVQQPGVVDGVIQGSSVRLVMAEPKPPDVRPLGLEEQDVVGRAATVRGCLRRSAWRRAEGRLGPGGGHATLARSMSTWPSMPAILPRCSAASRRLTGFRSTSSAARSSGCWAPTEPASRRRSK